MNPFEETLNRFLDDTMARWFRITKETQRIGLSIQLQGAVQDSTPTRERGKTNYSSEKMKAHYRNSFCRSVYADYLKEPFCNNLDFCLKGKINRDNRHDSISCRCHQGVSNVLIPYQYPNDDLKIVWYIFIGQFILLEETNDANKKLASEWFAKLNIVDVNAYSPLSTVEASFIKPGIFVKEADIDTKFMDSTISKIRFLDFVRFREFALTRFQNFLDMVYGRDRVLPGPPLKKDLVDYVKEKQRDLLLLDVMTDIFHILAMIPKSHPMEKFNGEVTTLREKFNTGIPDNLNRLEGKAPLLKAICESFGVKTNESVLEKRLVGLSITDIDAARAFISSIKIHG